jgi:hypothetical protein
MKWLSRMVAVSALALVVGTSARADQACRLVEVQMQPAAHLQLAVWLEDPDGKFVDTLFVTRSTGALGLGNRPGSALFKSAYRWPYGRREMVLPVWAHAHGKLYPYIVMGGAKGVDPHDDSIGYHEAFSTPELFYCPPSSLTLDATSCASQFVGSKGIIRPGSFSYYPPRADLHQLGGNDSEDAATYASLNDIAAISGATPPGGTLFGDIHWPVPSTLSDGSYVLKVEASLEGDVNSAHDHQPVDDRNLELNGIGSKHPFGQPSVVWKAPVIIDGSPQTGIANGYLGYGDWDGQSGTLHPPDSSISDSPGSGAGRLARVTDADGTWQVKAFALGCNGCKMPSAPSAMQAKAADTRVTIDFQAPASIDAYDRARRYEIRYQTRVPLDDSGWDNAIPADGAPAPGAPGDAQQAKITGLKALTTYYVGIRAINACGQAGPGSYIKVTTEKQTFTVLHGCFIATAAWGSPMQAEVALLRRFRDDALLGSPLGRLAVASYYALSPPLAEAIASDERLRAAAREALAPAVALARAWLLYKHLAR